MPHSANHSPVSNQRFYTFLLFIVRTMAASMAYLLSLSTSSITFFFSSVGGRGTLMRFMRSVNFTFNLPSSEHHHMECECHWLLTTRATDASTSLMSCTQSKPIHHTISTLQET
eukprot:GHRR01028368.1.p1 GENE.GHRR01028368.1~~GHRR01028368.1.p1  ORF type:complete len:114 (-),score=6.53 GHRR01028368.1:308-649(-)